MTGHLCITTLMVIVIHRLCGSHPNCAHSGLYGCVSGRTANYYKI